MGGGVGFPFRRAANVLIIYKIILAPSICQNKNAPAAVLDSTVAGAFFKLFVYFRKLLAVEVFRFSVSPISSIAFSSSPFQ